MRTLNFRLATPLRRTDRQTDSFHITLGTAQLEFFTAEIIVLVLHL